MSIPAVTVTLGVSSRVSEYVATMPLACSKAFGTAAGATEASGIAPN